MLHKQALDHVHYHLQAAATNSGVLSTGGLQNWIKTNVVPLLILAIGAGIVMLAQRQDHKSAISRGAIVLIALAIISLATGWQHVSSGLGGLLGFA